MTRESGQIVKSTAGFYYVRTPGGVLLECRGRGRFRKQGMSPLVGDHVTCLIGEDGKGFVETIEARRNSFIRPPVANADRLIIIASAAEPAPNLTVIDRLTAFAVDKGVEPVVLFTKCDLADAGAYSEIYRNAGIESFCLRQDSPQGLDRVRALFDGRICVLTGNTGVGKSTLLNRIDPALLLPTGDISAKLGRGRHTTRTVELFAVCGGWAVDTPGFSSLDAEGDRILKERLPECFPEFAPHLGACKFVSCAHIGEKGCAVCEAVRDGGIAQSRYDSYRAMYDEVKDIRPWNDRKSGG